jgi:uncharacterized membrane protein SpoIIM required for sporulation
LPKARDWTVSSVHALPGRLRDLLPWSSLSLAIYLIGTILGGFAAALFPYFPLHPDNSVGSVAAIFENNLLVLTWISLGAVTLGLTSVAELGLNGMLLGWVAVQMLERHQVTSLASAVLPQLPLELSAYVISGAASLQLGWQLWRRVFTGRGTRPIPWKAWMTAEVVAILLLLGGAVVERTVSHV